MTNETLTRLETSRYTLNQAIFSIYSCKYGTAIMSDFVNDFVDVFFCLETNFWHLAHINGTTSHHGYFSKFHAIMALNDDAVVWEH